MQKNQIRRNWHRLDSAALLFPAIMNEKWSNCFRLSATLKEEVDPAVLQQAVNDLQKRFPTFYCSIHQGLFWNYIEEIEGSLEVKPDFAYPLTNMGYQEIKRCAMRVLYYRNRIAVEINHVLSDGNGGCVYLCSLVAHYLELRKGIISEKGKYMLDPDQQPSEEELENSFAKYAGSYPPSRKERSAYHIRGTKTRRDYKILVTGIIDTDTLLEKAHEYRCTVTAFLSAVLCESIIKIQDQNVFKPFQKEVKLSIPIDMRKMFGRNTLRNFVQSVNFGVDPKRGEYSLQDLCYVFTHQLALEATRQNMSARTAANVKPQRSLILRLVPAFIKNFIISLVYDFVGEKYYTTHLSNLGNITLPENLSAEIERLEFILTVQKSTSHNMGIASFNNKTYINMIRSIEEATLEQVFFSRLVELGIPVLVESNRR
ncbi:MAG: hypothetical protein II712_04540 [Erysipelotrichaceae bacterium]|nr:hypothetical protein [Erysipelotrichaceae bacterium]